MWRSISEGLPKCAVLLVTGLFASGVSDPVIADSSVPLAGTRPAGVADKPLSSRLPASDLDTSHARSLLAAATAAYEAERFGEAQMMFERLVGRFPQSAEASSARLYLSRLYATLPPGGANVQRVSEERQSVAEAPPASTASPGIVSVATAKADENMIPSERLGEQLRSSVGDRIFFPPGSTDLGVNARRVLRGQAGWLKRQDESVKALIAGHADEPLDEDGNRILSARRAEAVRARLIEEGIQPDRVSVMALGRTEPVADCESPQCAAQNRRAVTIVLERRADQGQRLGSRSYDTPVSPDGPASW